MKKIAIVGASDNISAIGISSLLVNKGYEVVSFPSVNIDEQLIETYIFESFDRPVVYDTSLKKEKIKDWEHHQKRSYKHKQRNKK